MIVLVFLEMTGNDIDEFSGNLHREAGDNVQIPGHISVEVVPLFGETRPVDILSKTVVNSSEWALQLKVPRTVEGHPLLWGWR